MTHPAVSSPRFASTYSIRSARAALGVLLLGAVAPFLPAQSTNGFEPASNLPDLSGLAFVGNGRFLAVHDAKNPDELNRPRVSLLQLPQDLQGIL